MNPDSIIVIFLVVDALLAIIGIFVIRGVIKFKKTPTQQPPASPGSVMVSLQYGLIFGGIIGIIDVVYAAIVDAASSFFLVPLSQALSSLNTIPFVIVYGFILSSPIYVLLVTSFFLAGLFAAHKTKKASTGMLAGLWVGILYLLMDVLIANILFTYVIMFPQYAQSGGSASEVASIENFSLTAAVSYSLVAGLILAGIGPAVGALGAKMGSGGRPVAAVVEVSSSMDNSGDQAAPFTLTAPARGLSVAPFDPGLGMPISPGPQPGRKGGRHMQQDLFLQRDELARAYQLGELQKDYTTRVGKRTIALMGGIALFILIIAGIPVFISLGFSWGLLVVMLILIATYLLSGLIVGGILYYSRRLHIYVYTSGLLYLNRNKRRAVRWEQITRVSNLFRGSFSIYVKDEPRIGFGGFINQIGELYSTIEGEVDNHRPQQPAPSPGKLADPGPQVSAYAGSQPGRKEGSHAQQDELARTYQLGEFQKDYTIAFGKQIKGLLFGVFIALGTLIPTIGRIPMLWTLIVTIFYALVIGSVLGRLIYSYYLQVRVYLYTGGLLYLRGNKRTAVRWEQINNVSRRGGGGAVSIDWGGPTESRLRLSSLIDHIGGLSFTIKRQVDTHRSSTQAQERKEGVSMRCQYCNAELEAGAVFCNQCGRPVAAGAAEVLSNTQESTASSSEQFGSYSQTPDYPDQQIVPDVEQHPSQAGFASQQSYQGTMPASQFNVQPPFVAASQPPTRRVLWIILGTIGALVLTGGIVLIVILAAAIGPSATGTLNAYCSALKSGDYQTAYTQFSSGLQGQIAEAQFATFYPFFSNIGLGKVTNCAVSNVNDAAGSGTVSITFASNHTLVQDDTLVNQNGNWKINSYRTRSSPTLTLVFFCGDLENQDFPAAYSLLSSERQSQQSERQFASLWTATVSSCTVSNIDDVAGTGTISFTFANGGNNVRDYTLIDENGTWKIISGQLRS